MRIKGKQSFGASTEIIRRAKSLRKKQTPSEERLWQILRNGNLNGLKFRRQHPLSRFIVDFYCHELKLVVEVDGDIHKLEDVKLYDEIRESVIRELGLTVIRFSNEDVYFHSDLIVMKILEFRLQQKPNSPHP